jgi:hypothetical protein
MQRLSAPLEQQYAHAAAHAQTRRHTNHEYHETTLILHFLPKWSKEAYSWHLGTHQDPIERTFWPKSLYGAYGKAPSANYGSPTFFAVRNACEIPLHVLCIAH